MNEKFIQLMNSIKSSLNKDPFVSDTQVQQYRKLLKLNLKEQGRAMKDLKEQANLQMKVRTISE